MAIELIINKAENNALTSETQIPVSSDVEAEKSIDWVEILSVLWNSRKLIAYVTASATVLSIIVSLLLPEYFRSTATLLPETEKSKLSSLGGISDIAALAGVSVGGEGSLAKLYPTIIKSEAVLKNVIYAKYQIPNKSLVDSASSEGSPPSSEGVPLLRPKLLNLIQYWEIEEKTPERSYEVALKALRDQLEVALDNKTSVSTLAIETREPQLSADIINKVTAQLDEFIRTKRTTNASEQRKWIDARLAEVKTDLEKSENKLKEFRERNRRVSDSPQLLLEQERLIREMQINSTLYTELKKQNEIAKIEEIKNVPIVNVMDAARPAARKEKPKRLTMTFYGFFLSLTGSVVFIAVRLRYGKKLKEILEYVRR